MTGAGQGIGKGIAQRLISEGMRVVVADIDAEVRGKTFAELGSQDGFISGQNFVVDGGITRKVTYAGE